MSSEPRFRLTLRSEPSSVPTPVRLRKLLKHELRWLRFRCEALEELPAEREQTSERGPPTT
jgi:hypothetical protein